MKKITFLVTLMLTSFYGFSQTSYYSNDFEAGLGGWVATDLNNDTYNWAILNASSVNAALGNGSLMSFSYNNSPPLAITPNNLVTSPAINLTAVTDSNLYLFYDQVTNASYPAEHYAVYITTSNDPAVITASTPIYETTVNNGALATKSFNITSYIGQTIYVSYRHFDCNDQYFLIIDNVNVKSLASNDVQLVSAKLNRYAAMNSTNTLNLTVKNTGINPVTNLTINWNDGETDHIVTVNKNIAVGATGTVNHPTTVQYSTVVDKNITITITQVNGVADSFPANNTGAKKFNTVSQASKKRVLIEEGTGTWCGWCPRGAVALDYMDANFADDYVGVAVHNGDPMVLTAYDNGADFSGFPGMNVDRVVLGADVSQGSMSSNVNSRKTLTTPVSIEANGSVTGSNIIINANATFRTNLSSANYRLGVIISENNVTGTASGYKQTNYYAGGNNGPMGGYESLPSSVPANQMVYQHVGRALLGGYQGQVDSVPANITDGQTITYTFNYTVPATSNINNMHAVIVLIDQETGEVLNARSADLATLAVSQNTVATTFEIYPNPTSDFFNVSNLKGGDYTISIYDLSGRLIQTNKKEVIDNQDVMISIQGMAKGEYIVNFATGNTSYSKQLLVK